jgi:hypothetical protein
MRKIKLIRIVLSVVVFFAVFLGIARIIAFSLEGELMSRELARVTVIILLSNAVIASFIFNIMFKMRFEKNARV